MKLNCNCVIFLRSIPVFFFGIPPSLDTNFSPLVILLQSPSFHLSPPSLNFPPPIPPNFASSFYPYFSHATKMTCLNFTKVLALAIILLPLIAILPEQNGIANIVSAAPTNIKPASSTNLNKRLLVSSAPEADTIDGAHILLMNDVDTSTPKFSFLLLSKPRSYYEAAAACESMSDSKLILMACTQLIWTTWHDDEWRTDSNSPLFV